MKKLLIISACVLAGQAVAKRSHCKEVNWPWLNDWKEARCIVVYNTRGAGHGSFRWAVDQANSCDKPVHIKFCIPTHDLGYNFERRCCTIKMLEPCVITNKVWIDGFSQECSRPNTNPRMRHNNTCWTLEFAGGTTSKDNSYGFEFAEGADGSVLTGAAIYGFTKERGWDAAICTKASHVTVCGVATSTDCTGTADKPNTCTVYDKGTDNYFGLPHLPEARSIWGGLGSSDNDQGALTFTGKRAHLIGGTLGLDRCGTKQLNEVAEIGALVNVPVEEEGPDGQDLKVDYLTAAGFSECIICVVDFDDVCIANSFVGTDITNQIPITPTKIAIEVKNMEEFERGNLELLGNCVGGVQKAVMIGQGSTESLEKVTIDNNNIGCVPNEENVQVTKVKELELTNNTASNATNGNGVVVAAQVAQATVTNNVIQNNSNTGLVVATTSTTAVVHVGGGIISGNNNMGIAVSTASQVIVGSNVNVNNNANGGLGVLVGCLFNCG